QDHIDIDIPNHLRLTGAKLSSITQAKAYKAIRNLKMKKITYQNKLNRRATLYSLQKAKRSALTLSGKEPTDSRFWKSIRHKDFTRQVHYFLWMAAHNAYKTGNY
ncbi:hypothetical protein GYMLUDRAFT_176458, partial [Collybiopsis luxurians FD-317 M1]